MTKVKEDLILRIEDLEKSQIELNEENSRQHNELKLEASKGIKNLNDEFDKKLNEKIDKLRDDVEKATTQV